jgi:hypothetical protein
MVVFSDEHEQLPLCHHRHGWEPLLDGLASPGVPTSTVRHTPPARLQRGRSCLPRSHVYGPWPGQVRGQCGDTPQPDGAVDDTSLCESRLTDTAAMPIALFLIHNQEDPVWKQHLDAVSNPEGPHFHIGISPLARYAQHMFNLQASTARTVIQQHLHSGSLGQHVEELSRANAILHSGTPPPSDQDHELLVMYRRLSEAEHGWHYFRQQLDFAHEMLDERTHVIIHHEHHIEQQGLELEERAAMITDLEH